MLTSKERAEPAELGLKLQDTRGRLSTLVIQERLTRIPGIAKFPARYRLKTRITPWGATQATQRQSRG